MRTDVERFMRLALAQAGRSEGRTLPNPCVGAVVVKAGKVVGRGFHRQAGAPHAEVVALRSAGGRARGAVLYCTLEPCDHRGRTGPCTQAIIRAGIRRVVIGMKDPNPLVSGKGVRRLRRAGIGVRTGFLGEQAAALNLPYIFAHRHRRPMVMAKAAQSLDGKTATRTGASQWITGPASRRRAHRERASFDAILTGIGTVLADDPRLEAVPARKVWTKVVVDSKGRMPLRARLLKTSGRVIVATVSMSRAREEALRRKGATVVRCPGPKGRVDMGRLMRVLHRLEVRYVLAEAGASLTGSLFDARLVDRVAFYLAPKVIGGADALPAVGGIGVARPSDAPRLRNISCHRLGPDLLIAGDVVYPAR